MSRNKKKRLVPSELQRETEREARARRIVPAKGQGCFLPPVRPRRGSETETRAMIPETLLNDWRRIAANVRDQEGANEARSNSAAYLGERACRMIEEIDRLRAENARLIEAWPRYYESEPIAGVVQFAEGEWWIEMSEHFGGFATKREAIEYYLSKGISTDEQSDE